jgi:hypothetical protein
MKPNGATCQDLAGKLLDFGIASEPFSVLAVAAENDETGDSPKENR